MLFFNAVCVARSPKSHTMKSPRIVATFLLLGALGVTSATARANASPWQGAVDQLHQALLTAMQQSSELGFEGRYQLLSPTVQQSFDFATISRIVTGRYWRDFSPEQRDEFTALFARFSIATYAARFDGYSGESFRFVDEERMNERDVLVRTEIVRPREPPVSLNYVVHNADDDWRIVNVIAQGVSDLSLRRAEFAQVLGTDGYDALTSWLDRKIADLAEGRGP